MKFKNLFLGLTVAAALLAGGCSQQKKQKAEPVLTKNEVIQKSQKGFKSGQVIQSLRLSTDTSSQLVVANTTFGGNPTVFHINSQTTANGKTRSSEEWVNQNNAYLNGSSKWYKADLQKLSGHSYAELLDAITNNKVIFNPDAALKNAYKLKRNKQTYTLTAKTSDPKMMKATADDIVGTIGQSQAQENVFKNIQKYGKYRNMTVTMVVKNKKLYACNIFVNLSLGKLSKVRLGQSFGNFGSHDFLKVPTNALNAEQLPMGEQKKRSNNNKNDTKTTAKKVDKAKNDKK